MVGHQRRPSADILPFRAARRPRAGHLPATSHGIDPQGSDSQGTDSHSADAVRGTILLFTGVRYERLPDPAEPGLSAPERRCRS